jgi:transcription-repair coupling factor (superfamily II helicase)
MSQAIAATTATVVLRDLPARLELLPGFPEVLASLAAGHGATLDGVWGSSCALVAATLARHAPGPLVVVCPHPADLDGLADDLRLFTNTAAEIFPAREAVGGERVLVDEVFGDRLRLLKRLAALAPHPGPPPQRGEGDGVLLCESLLTDDGNAAWTVCDPQFAICHPPSTLNAQPSTLLLTSIQGLLQPVPAREVVAARTRTLQRGQTLDVPALLTWLVEHGFHATTAVELPGECSSRGGILDLFAPDWLHPVRVELFGDEIESLRAFEISTQRSLEVLEAIDLTLLGPGDEAREHLAGYLPANAWFLLVEPPELEEEGRRYLERVAQPAEYHSVSTTLRQIAQFPAVTAERVARGSLEANCHLRVESVERFSGDLTKVRTELDAAGAGQQIQIVCQSEAEVARLTELFAPSQAAAEGRLYLSVGHLQAGFRLVPERLVLIAGGELFHRHDLARPTRRRLGRAIDSFLELREGDYVVHLAHGIARYRGLRLLEKADQAEEHLELEFRGGTKVFVPSSKINLVQKYVGGTKARPTLAAIGGAIWARQKQAALAAATDLAADMLELQAARASQPGITFPRETPWQREFAAAFPYRETADQLSAIRGVEDDMCAAQPMDRLICGDVGYGKTEVAMRAAFKAVDSGYQVAVLVPTTVLAEQHRRTFTERMAEYPFRIATLSRFSTRAEQQRTIQELAAGQVDIVIGTHRLVQADVQLANLGLVIIDEEQRFGVEVKERLKTLRQIVDVLTLTATPIPRTLHMSLLGLRDISNLETPPEDRLAVETRVTRFDPDLVRHAALRELNRGGQIYFVHNRIEDIELLARRLLEIVPEARLRIGHGQMPEGELEEVMLDFVDHRFDVLLSTTIVESGLDIPNANTMFIDEADRYGLADLHQLRGRVGRYKHRAYCYLLVDPHKALSPASARRLRAIEEFSDVGAGFAVAMRDLEIRGAGNILGTQQSGHIATVGYELYCELLEQAVRTVKKLPPRVGADVHIDLPGEAYLPRSYVPDMRLKIDLYRRLARAATAEELAELAAELADRFGPRPAPVERLLRLGRLRVLAQAWQVTAIHLEPPYAVLRYLDRESVLELVRRSGGRLRVADAESAYLPLGHVITDADGVLAELETLLRPASQDG